MNPDHEEQIRKIMAELQCSKDFVCHRSGFANLCKTGDIGSESFLECLEKNREGCLFLLSYANVHFCDCPLRVYIAKKLQR